jgi:hypothetical protein
VSEPTHLPEPADPGQRAGADDNRPTGPHGASAHDGLGQLRGWGGHPAPHPAERQPADHQAGQPEHERGQHLVGRPEHHPAEVLRTEAERDVTAAPQCRADGRVAEEVPVGHPQAPGRDRDDGVEHRQEGRRQDHAPAAVGDESLGAGPALVADAPTEPTAPQRRGEEPAERERHCPPDERADHDGRDNRERAERAAGRDRREDRDVGRNQHTEHRNRVEHEHAAEQDADERG